ncbi:Lrp/AsnC family transcription regulator (plasmid) [Natrialba magadii ATCC 43099]|uniref:AsnC family transcriptional regulator n=1 Tax=Natrialba magadii (strain ATCC 43099 / DSM 3394 / CCM 3739 / CIP 104546 / IAM 13178 / JCM 8861 / NBRC 102185 / NCIMB 2190 / MS3) TaxID=547559 RepID=D3T1L9_NATMM|nr:Lrp/AsnC family transcriptional regulator [Natrialba magadii]ADD07478.1 Lrp/AsnC family transcription regulator [Natrialba magadii ATCC 43099]ELY32196.1 AsnC family transcriptional regulator [Natrialba magadii ATCC 43099]
MTAALDETDVGILARVEQSSEMNLEELAEELELSKSTIHYRLTKLKDNEVITATASTVDPHALGLDMLVFTDVTVSHESGYAADIGEAIAEIDGVSQVYYVMGDIDFIVISRVQTHDQLHALIDDIVEIAGVNETSSQFVIQEVKTDGRVIANMSDEMIGTVLESD